MTLHSEKPARDYAAEFPLVVLSWLGAYLVFTVGGVHLLQTDELVKDGATPFALLFIVNFALCCVAAFLLGRGNPSDPRPWTLGALVCGLSLVAFLMSRIVGLPGLPASHETWFNLPGAISVALELSFLGVAGLFLTGAGRSALAAEQRAMQNEPTPKRISEIEGEMESLRAGMSTELQDAAGKMRAGEVFSAVGNEVTFRAHRLARDNRSALRRAGLIGGAIMFLAALRRDRRR